MAADTNAVCTSGSQKWVRLLRFGISRSALRRFSVSAFRRLRFSALGFRFNCVSAFWLLSAFQRLAFWSGCISVFWIGVFQRLRFWVRVAFRSLARALALCVLAFRHTARQHSILSGAFAFRVPV
eukprot:8884230-Alexandrium_andersonii.AAC.2